MTSTPSPQPAIDPFWMDVSSAVVAQVIGWVIVGLITVTILNPRSRRAVVVRTKALAKRIGEFRRWLLGLRVTSDAGRTALRQEGYDLHSQEIGLERTVAYEPRWRVDTRDKLGTSDLVWLENSGYMVSDVALTCDPELLRLDGDVFWSGPFGDDLSGSISSKWFRGTPTERGTAEGVTFHVTWRDRNGDPHTRDVFLPPAEIRAGRDEEIEEAVERGRQMGREELQAELESKRKQLVIRAQWALYKVKDQKVVWGLKNMAGESKATNISLEVDRRYFHPGSSMDWVSCDGDSRVSFRGIVTPLGLEMGFDFVVHWDDVNGERQMEVLPQDASPGRSYGII